MADLERIKPLNEAQLQNVFNGIGLQSQRRLSDVELTQLSLLVTQMADRYPSQDLEASLEGYTMDLEQLALKYSIAKIQSALAELRITPGQKFFPRPDEVAEMIERQREVGLHEQQRREGEAWIQAWRHHANTIRAERSLPEYKAWTDALNNPQASAVEQQEKFEAWMRAIDHGKEEKESRRTRDAQGA